MWREQLGQVVDEHGTAPTTVAGHRAIRRPGREARTGGSITYGLEADTSGGWCLQKAQLAIAGIQVARTIYDTLTMPDQRRQDPAVPRASR